MQGPNERSAVPGRGLTPSDLRFDPPELDEALRRDVLRRHWGIEGRLDALDGERDQNTRVTTADGRSFVLKTASQSEDPASVDLQCSALEHVARRDPGLGAPTLVPSLSGATIVAVEADGVVLPTRLLTFVPGETFADLGGEFASHMTDAELHGVGAYLARLATAFDGFEHAAATNFVAWSLDNGVVEIGDLWDGLGAESRACAEPYRERVANASRGLRGLRRRIVHNDAHPGNLLRGPDGGVAGVIDFGDIADTALVADLAICAAGFTHGRPDGRATLCSVAGGYHSRIALAPAEVDLLGDLVLTRMVLGLLLVEFQARHAPPHRLDEVAGGLPYYRASIARWGQLDPDATTSALREHLARVEETADLDHREEP